MKKIISFLIGLLICGTAFATYQTDQYNVNDSNTYITEDGSSNMTFTDAVTGTKTLAQLSTGGGDSISVDGSAVTDPNFASTGDIDFVDSSNTVSGNINTGAVGDAEIDYSAVTLDDFDYQTAWRLFYSDTNGDVTELAFGSSGEYLKSSGTTSAPSWDTPSGGSADTDWTESGTTITTDDNARINGDLSVSKDMTVDGIIYAFGGLQTDATTVVINSDGTLAITVDESNLPDGSTTNPVNIDQVQVVNLSASDYIYATEFRGTGTGPAALDGSLSISSDLTVRSKFIIPDVVIGHTLDGPSTLSSSDHLVVFENTLGATLNISEITARSDRDDTNFILYETSGTDHSSLTTIHNLTISTNGTNVFYENVTSPTHTTIEDGNAILFDNNTGDPADYIFFQIKGWFGD